MIDSEVSPEVIFNFVVGECQKLNIAHEGKWIADYLFNQVDGGERLKKAREILQRRKSSEPLAYILGSWAFREFEFLVGPGVLIPRPETEELVEYALTYALPLYLKALPTETFVIYDLGAGSGCAGLSFAFDLLKRATKKTPATALAKIELHLVERSPEALVYLEKNIERFKLLLRSKQFLNLENSSLLEFHIIKGDWNEILQSLPSLADIVLSNPPYLSLGEWEQIDDSVKRFEPVSALVPERDVGLALSPYFELAEWANIALKPKAFVLAEMGTLQPGHISGISKRLKDSLQTETLKDMSGKIRFLRFHTKFT